MSELLSFHLRSQHTHIGLFGSFLFNTLVLALFPATKNVFRKHKHHEKWAGFTDKCYFYLAKEIANIMSKKMGSFYLPGSCFTVLMGNFFDI